MNDVLKSEARILNQTNLQQRHMPIRIPVAQKTNVFFLDRQTRHQ